MNKHIPPSNFGPAASELPPSPYAELSFVSATSFWDLPILAGGNALQWEWGEKLGQEYLAYVAKRPVLATEVLIGWIVGAMLEQRRNKLTGVELGFLCEVNKYATASAGLLAARDDEDRHRLVSA